MIPMIYYSHPVANNETITNSTNVTPEQSC